MPNNNDAPLPSGEGPGARAAAGEALNPYVQVALTYVRRPFSSWPSALVGTVRLRVHLDLFADRAEILRILFPFN